MKRVLGIFVGLVTALVLGYRHFNGGFGAQPPMVPAEEEALTPVPPGEPTVAPHPMAVLPAPSTAAVEIARVQNPVLVRMVKGDTNVFKLSAEQVQAFLGRNKTNADSLLAAFNITGDPELLREASRRYPSNALVVASVLGHNALPEQRRELIDQFKRVASDNPMPNYLSAHEYLQNQQPQLAVQELAEASGKGGFSDYTIDRQQGLEELYLSSGYSAAESKALAAVSVQEPALPALRDLARELSTLERQYSAAGDPASAAAVAKLGLGLAANMAEAGTKSIGAQMLGASAERDFLTALDPNGSYDFIQQPIGERLGQLQADRQAAVRDSQWVADWLQAANEPQLVSYFDRMKLYGEAAALNWARTQTSEIR